MLYYIITYSYNNISFKLMVLKNIINIFVSFKLDLFCIVSNRNIVVDWNGIHDWSELHASIKKLIDNQIDLLYDLSNLRE